MLTVFSACFAQAEKEITNPNIAVMQGPTGFSSVMLSDDVNIFVYPSPNEAVAKLANGELDFAVLPADAAVNLFNKGVKIRAVAIVGEGMLSVVGTDINNSTLSVPGYGGTPDNMATLLYPQYERDYSITAPAQLAQMLIAGKCKLAILPQPFVSMVISKNSNIQILSDVQTLWFEKTGIKQYPMSILVVHEDYADENKGSVEKMKKNYRQSIESVLSDPHSAALKIEEKEIMKAELAEPAIKYCALVYKDGKECKEELNQYYKQLLNIPVDNSFYY